jgi:hypothetical protein
LKIAGHVLHLRTEDCRITTIQAGNAQAQNPDKTKLFTRMMLLLIVFAAFFTSIPFFV